MAGSSSRGARPKRLPPARRLLPVVLAILVPSLCRDAVAHPAHAKPVNYPYVVGFERFHSSLDDDEHLAAGGRILLNELNCVACHAPPSEMKTWLGGVEATDLEGAASRLDPIDLEILIRNPRFLKRDTMMPSLFAGPDRDLSEVEALKHFLGSLTAEIPSYPRGDIDRGRRLYHRIGCASCHAPEVGYRPDSIPENAEIELAGLPSVPMNLADLYGLEALTHFLLDPLGHRPSGRMPDFRLSVEEAADLAAYLKAGPDLTLPDNLAEALSGREAFAVDEDLAEDGRAVFVKKQCHACHSLPAQGISRAGPMATPLAQLPADAEGGCLAPRPVGGAVPFYGLDVVQKRAIRAALARLGNSREWTLEERIDWRMMKLNCYACHERGGKGGAETAREVYFGFSSEKAIELGRSGHLPPALDRVGARLRPEALDRILLDGSKEAMVRDYLVARMPRFHPDQVGPLPGQFEEADAADEGKDEPPPAAAEAVEEAESLFREEGCHRCHAAGGIEEARWPGIDLTGTTDRIRFGAFDRLLGEPASGHPPRVGAEERHDPLDPDESRLLWQWLRTLEPRKGTPAGER